MWILLFYQHHLYEAAMAQSVFGVSLCHTAVEGEEDDKDKYEM